MYKLRIILKYLSENISVKCKWNFLQNPIESVQIILHLLFQHTRFLMFSQKISKPTGWNQQIGKQCFLPPLSFTISLRVTSFHISLNSSGFLSLQNACLIIYSNMYGKNFSIYGVHIPIKCIESLHFYSCPSPPPTCHSKLHVEFFENLFPSRWKGWTKL